MKVYKRIFQYVKEVSYFAWMSMALSAVSSLCIVCGYYFIYLFLYDVVVLQSFHDALLKTRNIVIALTIGSMLYLLSGVVSHKFAFRLETNLRKHGIAGLTNASFQFFDMYSSGYIRKTIDDNAAKTHTAVAHMIPDNVQAFVIPLADLFIAYIIHYQVGIAMTLLVIVSFVILTMMMGNQEFMKLYHTSLDKLSAESVEYVRGIQVVKIFGNRLQSFKAFYEAIVTYAKYAYDYSLSCKVPYTLYQLIFLSFIAIITIPLSFFLTTLTNPAMLVVKLITLFFLSGSLMVSFMKIMYANMHLFNAQYAIDQLEDLYNKMQEDKLSYGNVENFANYNIDFKNVSFSYGNKSVLENVSFHLEANKTYALVGHSGSGKSTIAKLLSGFYKVNAGVIEIGGRSLEQYSKEAILKNIAFVFQDSKLFKTTIYDNVAIAKENTNHEEVMQALHMAGCDDILDKFVDRENTLIGSKGVYLSGGEKQRIAIARAILKDAPIVIMDEASASLDADNEYELLEAFKNLMKNKTTIMVAHRITSISHVDEILVLENGKVVERGNHQELFQQQGIYADLYNLYETANDWRLS